MPEPILKATTFCKFPSVQDFSTFPCWNCIKYNSGRKTVTCSSNQRTVEGDGDLSKKQRGKGRRSRTGRPSQNFCTHYEASLVLTACWYESLAQDFY